MLRVMANKVKYSSKYSEKQQKNLPCSHTDADLGMCRQAIENCYI